MKDTYFTNIIKIGDLERETDILWYDGPFLFVCSDKNKKLYICLRRTLGMPFEWILVPTTSNELLNFIHGSGNKYVKFDNEDGVRSFQTRKYLEDKPTSTLDKMLKDHDILKGKAKWSRWSKISEIIKLPDINEIIYQLIKDDKYYVFSDED